MEAKELLIDVAGLSKKWCLHPIESHLAYATQENFLGRIVKGYHPDATNICLLTPKAAKKLCLLQNALVKKELCLHIFDAFRPLRAVKDFGTWYSSVSTGEYEDERKKIHYPHLKKSDLVPLGYGIGTVSRHCFGHAVDLSIKHLSNKTFLDMGTCFDFFDPASHLEATDKMIGRKAVQNRKFLAEILQQFGFIPYFQEWWHFDYQEKETQEPMDLEITSDLQNLGIRNFSLTF